ncbi:MAG: tail-specific protease [Monoraphidium minutum]|nr:MAG: tail-specific protease [Monoraphidium minutum]
MQTMARTGAAATRRSLAPRRRCGALTTDRAVRRGPAPRAQRRVRCDALPSVKEAQERLEGLARSAAAFGAAALCSASLLLAPPALSEEGAPGGTVIRLPASDDPAIFTAQQTMVQAWQIVGESFVDPSFGGHSWTDELRTHMLAAYQAPDSAGAYQEISSMLQDLGDPYTRLLPPDEYQDFVVSSNGELQGVGMLIANEPFEGHLLVLAPIKGSPADRAGILPGDIVTAVNDQDTSGWTGEQAARHLRGLGGTQVRVRLLRHTDQIPGVAGRPPRPVEPATRELEVSMTRETVALSPLSYAALPGPGGAPVGYLRLASFSQNAGQAVRDAIVDLKAKGVASFVLDLRSNPGGLVQSAADVARVFMDGSPTLFSVSGRAGQQLQEVILDEGAPETGAPLAVLVDHGSASASEILSGALRDNHRAVVVGDEKTYGKGRIQSVFEMDDGSALFVTVARYRTPSGADIDLRGIRPDLACSPPLRGGGRPASAPAAPRPRGAGPLADYDLEDSLPLAGLLGAAAGAGGGGGPPPDACLLTAMNALADPSALMAATQGSAVAAAP